MYRSAVVLDLSDFVADELPDPPENLDFLLLPESFQAIVAERFERGTAREQARIDATVVAKGRAPYRSGGRRRG